MLTLILGNQLFDSWLNEPKGSHFLMIEHESFVNEFKFHKHKMILLFSAMREFAKKLREAGFQVTYIDCYESKKNGLSFFEWIEKTLKKEKAKQLQIMEIPDRSFETLLLNWAQTQKIALKQKPDELFLTPRESLKNFLKQNKPFMKTFYEWQRKRLKILLEDDQSPLGGKWSFDSENRKKLPKDYKPNPLPSLKNSSIRAEVIKMVEDLFQHHPGKSDLFWLPTTSEDAEEWLNDFLKKRFTLFGPYEDAIHAPSSSLFSAPSHDFLNHSALSALINIGILPIHFVIKRTLQYAKNKEIPLPSLEGFIRQLIGWREFIYGMDQQFGEIQYSSNFFNHHHLLKECWWKGTTGLPPVDDAIDKANRIGYNHHIERLMILSNVMLLCETHPQSVYHWFMEMYVDSYEWVMTPNVFGMAQFSDGGIFATKPYISGSNYILKMSHYAKGSWCETWDALYWSFIGKNKAFFSSQYRLSMMSHLYDKMPSAKKDKMFEISQNFKSRTLHLKSKN